MLTYLGGGGGPEEPNFRLVLDGCEWELTREEVEYISDRLAPLGSAGCDEIERVLRQVREER